MSVIRLTPTRRGMCRWTVDPAIEGLSVLRGEITEFAQRSGLSPDETDAALLIVNELASNAIDHARTPCRVTVQLTSTTVRIYVSDHSTAEPVLRPRNVSAVRGRGIQIITGLARRWGWSRHRNGKTVWASMDRAPQRPLPASR
jgi:anti-sigma regulatory factor (Ser/Thr protein kinase)